MSHRGSHCGLFVGLTTLDLIYQVEQLPDRNQKIVALADMLAAGGPATNAAVTFAYLGNSARLVSVLGQHAIAQLVRAELAEFNLELLDLAPERQQPLPTSSILVLHTTGERSVVSRNAVQSQVGCDRIPPHVLNGVAVVLLDGHQMAIGQEIAAQAQAAQIPVVVDAGSWKPGFDRLLSAADYVLCSANFQPPQCHTEAEVLAYLRGLSVPYIAITHGEAPIVYSSPDGAGQIEVPQIQPVDTLGAGDIFHGAFCHFLLEMSFENALTAAAEIAARACQSFGTREWMQPSSEQSPSAT